MNAPFLQTPSLHKTKHFGIIVAQTNEITAVSGVFFENPRYRKGLSATGDCSF